MPTPLEQLESAWFIFLIAGVEVALLAWGGVFTRKSLARGPDRSIGLGLGDLLVGLGLFILGIVLAEIVIGGLVGIDAKTHQPQANSAAARAALVILGQLLQEGPVVAWFLWRAGAAHRGLKRVGVLRLRPIRDVGMGLLGLLVGLPVVISLLTLAAVVGAMIGYPAPRMAHELLPVFLEDSTTARIVLGVAVVLVGPILEESIFRGLLQSCLVEWWGRHRRWSAICLAAALFALVHLPGGNVPPHALIGLFALAVVLGWLYERTGSLWPSVLVHAGFNAFNLAMVLVVARSGH